MTNDLISREALKEAVNAKKVVGRFNTIQLIDNAPAVDTTCPNCDSGYAQGYSDGYLKGKEESSQGEWVEEIIEELESRKDYGAEYAQAMEDVIVILKAKFGIGERE